MTISATAPINVILSNPKSIMRDAAATGCAVVRGQRGREAGLRSGAGLRFDVDRVAVGALFGPLRADLLRRRNRRIAIRRGTAFLHAVLEALHRATEIGADVLELLGAEDQHDDQQHDEPVPDAE